jgi:hypothetical protein
MITIQHIAKELEEILNGTTRNDVLPRPIDGLFAVRTQGYHLDNVHDYETGKNFFPVFLGELSGEFNPIPDLGQVDMSVPVSIYFPVRFKDKMLAMQEYLTESFVGQVLGFNPDGHDVFQQYAVCNISLMELGEITDMDVDQFGNSILKGLNEFIEEQYKKPIETSEPWICLTFTIYLSTMNNAMASGKEAPIYGNAYQVFLQYSDWNTFITTDNVSIAYSSSTESQQGFELESGSSEMRGSSFGVTSAISITFEAVVLRNAFWNEILNELLAGKLNPNDFELQISLKSEFKQNDTDKTDFSFPLTCVVLTNFSTNIGVNEALTARFTFAPLAEVQ